MGVEWETCNHCGRTFPDCGDFVSCDCGVYWCSDECAEKDGFRVDELDRKGYHEETSCKYCRHEDYTDEELVNFMLKYFRVTREQMVTIFNGTTFSEESYVD